MRKLTVEARLLHPGDLVIATNQVVMRKPYMDSHTPVGKVVVIMRKLQGETDHRTLFGSRTLVRIERT